MYLVSDNQGTACEHDACTWTQEHMLSALILYESLSCAHPNQAFRHGEKVPHNTLNNCAWLAVIRQCTYIHARINSMLQNHHLSEKQVLCSCKIARSNTDYSVPRRLILSVFLFLFSFSCTNIQPWLHRVKCPVSLGCRMHRPQTLTTATFMLRKCTAEFRSDFFPLCFYGSRILHKYLSRYKYESH